LQQSVLFGVDGRTEPQITWIKFFDRIRSRIRVSVAAFFDRSIRVFRVVRGCRSFDRDRFVYPRVRGCVLDGDRFRAVRAAVLDGIDSVYPRVVLPFSTGSIPCIPRGPWLSFLTGIDSVYSARSVAAVLDGDDSCIQGPGSVL